jgi:hypothetical protein
MLGFNCHIVSNITRTITANTSVIRLMLMEQRNYVPELEINFFFNFVVLTIFIRCTYRNLWSDKVSALKIGVIYEENNAIVQAPITLHHFEKICSGILLTNTSIFSTPNGSRCAIVSTSHIPITFYI